MQTPLKRIREWFIAPAFPGDENKTHLAHILYALQADMLIFLFFAVLATIFIFVQKTGSGFIILGLLGCVLVSRNLVRRGRVLAASRLLVISAWIMFTLAILLTGKISTPFVSLQLAVTVMAGILLGRRSALTLTLLSILIGLGLALLESTSYTLFNYFPAPPYSGWMVWVLAFILTLTPLNPTIQNAIQAAKTLQDREMRFRSMYSQSPIAIELYDAEGHLTDINPACQELFGVANVEAVKGFKLFEDPNVPEDAKAQLSAGNAVNYQSEFDFDLVREKNLYETTKTGRCYLDCFITPWVTGKDTPGGYLVHIRDITQRLQAEDEFQSIIKTAMDGFWVTDHQGYFLDVNDAYCKLIGYSRAELLQMNISDVEAVESKAETAKHIKKAIAAGSDRFETKHRCKDDQIVDLEISATFAPHDDGRFYVFIRNITERKQVEKALQRNQALLNETGKMARVGGWEIDLTSQTLTWTDEVYRIHEVEAEFQPTVATAIDFYTPESKPVIEQAVQAAIEQGKPFDVELEIITAKGNRRRVHAIGQAKNNIVYGAFQDITERKQAEEALRESEERLELVLEGSQLGYWDWNIKTGEVHRNARWAEMLGYTLGEIEFTVKQWTDLHHPDDRERAWQSIQDHLEGRTSEHRVEYRMRIKDGGYKWILDQATIVKRDPQGNPLRMSGTHTDITDRKEAENIVERGRKLLASTLDALPVGVCLNDETGHYRMMNNAYCAVYEFKREEMLGQHFSVILPPDQVALANTYFTQLLSGDVGIPVERKRQRKDGSIVYVEAANALVENIDGQKMVITTVRDITDRKKDENTTRARLRVNEFAAGHSLSELLQNAMDELCALTDSPIGFFHFVEPDQRTLSLQAWSTRTMEEMCTAEGKGHSYDIDLAGVWVDCMRQGAPVIHNDYASLPHRRGLPEGHAPIIREMVFPIKRHQKMVAIIGVGNKLQNYTDEDLIHASHLADILWDITERKKAEEREHEQRALAEALSNSAAALNSTLDFNEVLDRIMDNVGRVVPHDAVGIILIDTTRQVAEIVGYRDMRDQPVDRKGIQFSVSQTRNLREMQTTGMPVVIANTDEYDEWFITPTSAWIRSNLGVPIKIKDEIIGFLSLSSAVPNAFTQLDAERLQAFVNHAGIAIENASLYKEVQKLAVTDTLTGVFNRLFFNAELTRLESSRDFPVSIIVADLDNLKTTNDSLGHPTGDELLRRAAKILKSVFRASDIITRIGGDEFAILLPQTNRKTVELMLTRIQERLTKHNTKNPDLPVLLSLGASTAVQGKLVETFAAADRHMYANKMARKSSKKGDD